MASFSWRSVKGLLRKPFAPRSIASTAVALSARAETTRMRTAGFMATSLAMHSMPSICGMVMSMVTTSGSVFLKSSSASSPLPAVPTSSSCSNRCERSIRRRMMFESSTIISLSVRLPPFLATALPLRMEFALGSSGDRAARRLRGRQHDLEAGESAGVGGDADLAAEDVDAARHDVHPDAAAGVDRHVLAGREAGSEDQRHRGARVHLGGFLLADQLLADCGGLERLGGDARAVVLEYQLVAVAVLSEVHADQADVLLGVRAARLRRLDAMHRGVAQHLDDAVLDGRGIGRRHVGESAEGEPEALGVVGGEPLRHGEQRRREVLHHPGLRAPGG